MLNRFLAIVVGATLLFGAGLGFTPACAAGPGAATNGKLLPSADLLQTWHVEKARGGPTFSGSPAWRAHIEFVEQELGKRGVVGFARDEYSYARWFVPDETPAAMRLAIGAAEIPVAAYWAYSGATGPEGVNGKLLLYNKSIPREALRGRIVVFEVEQPPESMFAAFGAGNVFNTGTSTDTALSSDQWYQGNFVTRFGRFDEVLKDSGALGGVVIFDMSPGRAAGLYTFPLLNAGVFGVPGLYVDRIAGATLRQAAIDEKNATLTLRAREETARPYFLSGILPGRDYGTDADRFVLLVTHSDGPNLTQENGTLGILGIVDYFSRVPQAERARSLLVLFDPQHYAPGRHLVDWYEKHPDLVERIVASIGVEQLGQREYAEQGNTYGLNGLAEPTLIFAQENERLVQIAIDAVRAAGIPRTEVRVPSRGKQGMWAGLGDIAIKLNRPGFAISSGMSGYWTTTPGMESFDKDLCFRQLSALVTMTTALMDTNLDDIAVPVVDPAKNPALSPGVRR